MLIGGILLSGIVKTLILIAAFVLVAWDIVLGAVKNIKRGDIFGENFLMTIAGIGAVCIGEIPEGVLVFLLYRLGEYLQTKAVSSSRKSISALLDVRPDQANLMVDDQIKELRAEEIIVGQTILVRPGEKVPLDGTVISGESQIDTAALTGESLPRDIRPGQNVMAGCINLNGALEIRVDKAFGESTASKILEMVEHASEKKAVSEKFITRFARIYTPIVVVLATIVAVFPALFGWMSWGDSLYSALCFLAISCPCALVISVPLSFFAGIGRASREGILVKGGNHLETMAQTEIAAFDKTGTLTVGKFSVHKCIPADGVTEEHLLEYAAAAEHRSTHPIAQSICAAWQGEINESDISNYQEIAGNGVSVVWNGHNIMAGRANYLKASDIAFAETSDQSATGIYVAADGKFLGSILISDQMKPTTAQAIHSLHAQQVRTVMLTGDSRSVAESVGRELGIDEIHSELLPADKVEQVERLLSQKPERTTLAFVGDGINDAPVLSRADIGIAMGAMGSDAAIEAADIVLMDDDPAKIALAMSIARKTMTIVKQNIIFALTVKISCLILTAVGITGMQAGIFADVGVMVLAVLNATRTLHVGKTTH